MCLVKYRVMIDSLFYMHYFISNNLQQHTIILILQIKEK